MVSLFFFGSLRDWDLLCLVLDRVVPLEDIIPATAPGYVARDLSDEAYPYLAEDPGATAEGVLVTGLTTHDMARLNYYEDIQYGLAPIAVQTPNGPAQTEYFRSTPLANLGDGVWDFQRWERDEKPIAIEAAREMMDYFGVVPADKIDDLWHGIMIRARMRARGRAGTPVTGALRTRRSAGDVQQVRLERPYTRYFAIEEHTVSHRRFDGTMSQDVQRTVLMSGDAVTVVPYDPASDRVLLIEQFRAAMHARGDACPWGIEAITGRIDQEIDPEVTARREAQEEAGLTLGALEVIATYYSSPGFAAEHITSFVGQADLGTSGGIYGLASENEDIRAFVVPLDQALQAVTTGEIDNAPLILSLLWLQANRQRLQSTWS